MTTPPVASDLNLCLCHSCGLACDMTDEPHECPRCEAPLHRRKSNSLNRTCGATTGAHPSADIQRLFVRQLSIHGSTIGSMEEFRRLVRAFEAGHLIPHIDSTFPLDEVPAALARQDHPDRLGKIVITIA